MHVCAYITALACLVRLLCKLGTLAVASYTNCAKSTSFAATTSSYTVQVATGLFYAGREFILVVEILCMHGCSQLAVKAEETLYEQLLFSDLI